MTTNRHIRPARVSDAAALLEIYGPIVLDTAISFELEPPDIAEFASRIVRITENHPWLVLEREGVIAGYAYASEFRARRGYAATRETTVYVHPDHQRTRVAFELMEALIADIRSRDTRLVVGVIGLPNEPSVALHESLGFRHAGTLHNVGRKFDRWYDEGFWELVLDSGHVSPIPR